MTTKEKKELARDIREKAARLADLITTARLAGLDVHVYDAFMGNGPFFGYNRFTFTVSITEPAPKPVEY